MTRNRSAELQHFGRNVVPARSGGVSRGTTIPHARIVRCVSLTIQNNGTLLVFIDLGRVADGIKLTTRFWRTM